MPFFEQIIGEIERLNNCTQERTLNTIETVANGCAIHAYQQEFGMNEKINYNIKDYNPNCIRYEYKFENQDQE